MSDMTLLICGAKKHFQVRQVCKQLTNLNVPFVVIDPLDKSKVSLELESNSLWVGSKKVTPFALWVNNFDLSYQYGFTKDWAEKRAFAIEWQGIIFNLLSHFKNIAFNPLESRTFECKKVEQLKLAEELGFRIPKSLVSNASSSVVECFSKQTKVLIKGIGFSTLPIIRQPGMVESFSPDPILISIEHLSKYFSEIDCAPMMIQEYFERPFDLRVIVIGDIVHAVKITKPPGMVDSRELGEAQIYEFVDLGESTNQRLREFMKRTQIHFGHFDFLMLDNGELIFLECNPEGIWALYDDHNKISYSIAKFFEEKYVS